MPISALTSPGTASTLSFNRVLGNADFDHPYFQWAWGIDTNGDQILVTDFYADSVHVLTMDGEYVKSIGESGTGNGFLSFPIDAIFYNNQIIVADTGNDRIQVFDIDGNYIQQFGSTGLGVNQFEYISSLETNGTHLFVVDSTREELLVFDNTYNWLGSILPSGTNAAEIEVLASARITDDFIYALDGADLNIKQFDLSGNYIRQIKPLGTQVVNNPKIALELPYDIEIYQDILYVADNHGIKAYTLHGEFAGGWFYGDQTIQNSNTELAYAEKLRIHEGKMYVTDYYGYDQITIWDVDVNNIELFAGSDNVRVSWASPSIYDGINVTAFNVYRGSTSNDLRLLVELPASEMSFLDLSVVSGEDYFYAVSAINEYGETNLSPVKSVSVLGNGGGEQETVTVTAGEATVTLNDGNNTITISEAFENPLPFSLVSSLSAIFVMVLYMGKKKSISK